jgi:hypothetical protein
MLNKLTAIVLGMSVALTTLPACSSTTVIRSVPAGAKLYLDGEPVGTTPYTLTDTKTFWAKTALRLEYPGYAPMSITLNRNEEVQVGALIGGLFAGIPFLWVMGYKPQHVYELQPLAGAVAAAEQPAAPAVVTAAAASPAPPAEVPNDAGKPCQPVPGMKNTFKCAGGLSCQEGICR